MRRLDDGARILPAKAPYNLEYVAAALAVLCGWFAKGNGTPNLTVAASKLRTPDAPPLPTRATARIKAWMERLRELNTAMKAEWQTHYRIRTAQDEAEALEVLRRGMGPTHRHTCHCALAPRFAVRVCFGGCSGRQCRVGS